MSIGLLFWVLYIVSIVLGLWGAYEPSVPNWHRRAGGYIVLWVLIGILGWHVFGPAIRG